MKSLFDKTKINGIELKNRFIRSATWEAMADEKGHLTPRLLKVYEELADGGVGLIITGYTFVTEHEQPNPRMMGIYDDSFIEEYKQLTGSVHSRGGEIVLQIVYGGTQTGYRVENREIWGPSAVPEIKTGVMAKEMTKEDIRVLVKAFGDAAGRAKSAGFDGVQFHCAHGYLLNQFLSPYHNRRTDEYGGSTENRARIVLEVYDEIRERVGGDFAVLIKINCEDFVEGGLTFGDTRYVCRELSKRGIDAIEISGGILAAGDLMSRRPGIDKPSKEAYFKTYASEVARETNTPIILVGGLRSLDVMEAILSEGSIDYFSISRPFLREPNLIKRWLGGDRAKVKCISCNKCFSPDGNTCIFTRNSEK